MTGPVATSWVPGSDASPFPIGNLPYGVFSRPGHAARVGVAIGDRVLDLAPALGDDAFSAPALNPFLGRGRAGWAAARTRITELLGDPAHRDRLGPHLHSAADVTLHLPFEVSDYVDFYSSEHHAANVGRILRPGGPALPINWRYLPAGYHGRRATVVVSGTPVTRPCGLHSDGGGAPVFGPTAKLDFEAEVGFVVGVGSELGRPVPGSAFRDHVFGVVLVNDWSARDIQAFEYVPLGPFLGKAFATSVSPWVVPLDALEDAFVPPPGQNPEPAEYLRAGRGDGLDLELEVLINGNLVARPPFRTMYWTPAQQLAHLTVGGAALRTGDLLASGTVSGPEDDEVGSLLERTFDGTRPLDLADGTVRGYLEDGDTVNIRATAPGPAGTRFGLGEVTGTVVGGAAVAGAAVAGGGPGL